MSLIKCPNCGHDLSDKAHRCPHCNYIFGVETIKDDASTHEVEENSPRNYHYYVIPIIIVLSLIAIIYFLFQIGRCKHNNEAIIDSDSCDTIATLCNSETEADVLRCYEADSHFKIANDYDDGHKEGDSICCFSKYTILLTSNNKVVYYFENDMDWIIYSGYYSRNNNDITMTISTCGVNNDTTKKIVAKINNDCLSILHQGMFAEEEKSIELHRVLPSQSNINDIIGKIETNNYQDLDYLYKYKELFR